MSEQLSGRALDCAIAKALGLVTQFQPHNEWWYVTESEDRGRQFTPIPDYSADANAVIDVCSARGWRLSFGRNLKKDQPYAAIEWDDDDWNFVTANGSTPQEAAARALLAAFTERRYLAAQP